MTGSVPAVAGLVVDAALLPVWRSAQAPEPLGLASAVAAGRAAVVAVLPDTVGGIWADAAEAALARALGVGSVEILIVPGTNLGDLLRQWINQAGQGSGRGVQLTVVTDPGGPDPGDRPGLRLLVQAIDSSARELALRLASPQEPALPALRAVLGGQPVRVVDVEEGRGTTTRMR